MSDICTKGIWDEGWMTGLREGREESRDIIADLLEVAKIAVRFAPCVTIRSWPPGFQMQRDLMTKAKAAIAKAEGK